MRKKRQRGRAKPPLDAATAQYYMKKEGLYQADFAEMLGVTKGAISQYINGVSYSQRFWDMYFQKVPVPLAS